MASADNSVSGERPVKAKAPFRERFKAWWEGYELADDAVEPESAIVEREAAAEAPAEAEAAPEAPADAGSEHWTAGRIELAQKVWGAGFTGPGGEQAVLDMTGPLGLEDASKVLLLGAGLGGAARALADRFDVVVDTHEADARLAKAGMALSREAGVEERAPVRHLAPDRLAAQPGIFDCMISREALFALPGKDGLLRQVTAAIKRDGQMIFTDYVLPDGGRRSPAVEAWSEIEPAAPELFTLQGYTDLLGELDLDIWDSGEVSEETGKDITQAWATYMAGVDQGALDAATARVMVEEAELWAGRVKLLEAGDLQVLRILAAKRS